MKILSRMLSKKVDPEAPAATEMDMEDAPRMPEADDSGQVNPTRVRSAVPPAADLSQPVMPKEEEPEVAGSGWGDASWDDDDWDDDEDWGEDDMDIELRRRTEDKKQLVSEIRDAMTSVSHVRPESVEPPRPVSNGSPDFSEDEEFGRKAKARSELVSRSNEDRILEKTETAMTEEGTSRRRSAMAHLKAAAAATKADRVLRHVVSRDPSADPEEQSPYRDDLAKVVRPHSTSRPISRMVSRTETRSPIWDQGEGDEDAALLAAAEDGFSDDITDSVTDEMSAAEAERIARAPMDLSEEDFASVGPDDSRKKVESAFPASPFARQTSEVAPEATNAFDDIGEDDFEDEYEDDGFAVDEDDDFAPRPSRVVSEAVAFANAPDEVVDETPPETEVRKKIWEMADEVAAEVGQGDAPALEAAAEPDAPEQPTTAEAEPIEPVASETPATPTFEAEPQNFAELSTAISGRAGRSAGRVKTRLLGFQANEDVARDVFEEAKEGSAGAPVMFPAGWIVVVDGPGRGSCFTLHVGVSQIGRGDDQAVRLDFGDTSISRNNHAAVAYDDEQGKFFLGHGGKSNLVRLNGMPVLSTEEMNSGDEIRIGETTLKFVALCGEAFTWAAAGETAAE